MPSPPLEIAVEDQQKPPVVHVSYSEKEKSRHYREEWKYVKDNDKATEDRMKNLIIDPSDPWGMWCHVCTKWAPVLSSKYLSNFVKDSKNFQPPRRKKESVDIHFKSINHSRCLEKEASTFVPVKDAIIYKKLTTLDEKVHKKMSCLVRNVFYFAVKDRAASDFASECQLQKLNGIQLGDTYQNQYSFATLLKYVALYFKNKTVDKINSSKFISVLTDGSTTKKNSEYEAVVVRYVPEGEYTNTMSFVGLCEIENANAEGLAKAITNCLDKCNIKEWQNHLICMTVDGASVNVGKHNGLVKILQSPIHVHCYNHLLDLCLKDSIKNSATASKIMALLKSINSFYRTSPKLTRELHRSAEALSLKTLSFKPICDTRWANSLENSVAAIVENFQSIVQHLTDIVSPHSSYYTASVENSAKSILKDLLLYDVVYFLHAFRDFFEIISKASLYLEKADINICDAANCVKSLQLDLIHFGQSGELMVSRGKHLETFLHTIDDSEPEQIKFKNIDLGTKNSPFSLVMRKNSVLQNQKNSFQDFCISTSKKILNRFYGTEQTENCACTIMAQKFDTAMFPSTENELKDYGEAELLKMCELFKMPSERALEEWRLLRVLMFNNFKPTISLTDLLKKLSSENFRNFKVINDLIQAIITIPPSNAEVERVWSTVKKIINDRSTSMSRECIENRIFIKNAKVNLDDFNPDEIIELWWKDAVKSRRPCFYD